MREFDLVVIGAGPGGYVAAIRGAQKGLSTAVIEKNKVGGTCLNRGCVPTKTIMESTHLFSNINKSEEFGISLENPKLDIKKVYERKDKIVGDLVGGIEQLIEANGIERITGKASIKDKNTVLVNGEEIKAKNIIIATGSEPIMIPNIVEHEDVFTSDSLEATPKEYKRIVIIGGGVIGIEFAEVYSAMGCEVTIVEFLDSILFRLDREIARSINMILKRRGINILTGTKVESVTEGENELVCTVTNKKDVEEKIMCDAVLVAVGRRPLTDGLFEEGFSLDMERGFIKINENLQTNVDNIYAIGDVTFGSIQLAHAASAEGLNAISHILGEEMMVNTDIVPSCIYTDPEIGEVGLNADQAKEQGIDVNVGKYIMSGNARTVISDADRSFIKIVSDKETNVVLGAQLMCPRATDLVSEITVAIVNKLTVEDLLRVIRPHPTFTEGVTEAAEDVFGTAIHMAPKRRR